MDKIFKYRCKKADGLKKALVRKYARGGQNQMHRPRD